MVLSDSYTESTTEMSTFKDCEFVSITYPLSNPTHWDHHLRAWCGIRYGVMTQQPHRVTCLGCLHDRPPTWGARLRRLGRAFDRVMRVTR